MSNYQKAQTISRCLQIATILEVSTQKPGNVGFESNFETTRIEHFLASTIAVGPTFQKAAYLGIKVANKNLKVDKVGVGELIKEACCEVATWQHGGNTILGTIILLIPIAIAAGMTPKTKTETDFSSLRQKIDLVVKSTTALDSVNLYEAVDIANPSGLGGAPDFDVSNPKSKKHLLTQNVGLFEVFKIAQSYDDICYEWVNNYPITFDLAYPYLKQQLKQKTLNISILQTFLKILSTRPDTFIARKAGKEKSRQVTLEAKKALELGGPETTEGKKSIETLDKKLRAAKNNLNPGTTADLTAAALALATLSGYRP